MKKAEFIQYYTTGLYSRYDIDVISFIAEVLYDKRNETDNIRSFFRAGYCYHFASMLLHTFQRGILCIAEPYGHIVWRDDDGLTYDIEGPYVPENHDCERLTDISFLGELIYDFLHIPNKEYQAPSDFHEWAQSLGYSDVFLMIKVYREMPREQINYTQTLETNVYRYWKKHKKQLQENIQNTK